MMTQATTGMNADETTERDVTLAMQRGPHRFLDVGGGRIASWRFGRGPDVVFIHGWPLHAATFRRVVPHLAGSFTCHLLDLPGAGQTEPGAGAPIDLVAHPATVRASVDALGLGDYALVAHDSGGFVARNVAAGDARVRGLVLGNTEVPGHTPWLVTMYALIARMPFGTAIVRNVLRSRALRTSALGFAGCFEDPSYTEGEFRDLFIAPLLDSAKSADGHLELLRTLKPDVIAGLVDVHRSIKAPVDLVWGVRDPFFPIAKARAMLDQFGGRAVLHEIPRAKLFAHEDHPAAFAAIAKRALASYFATPARAAVGAERPS